MPTITEEKTTANWMKEAQKGHIRLAVLIVLNRKPAHGYEIMKEIKEKTRGFYKPTPGGVYPILRSLEIAGYVKGEWSTQQNRRIKVYKITERGEHILKQAITKQSEIATSINTLVKEFARDVLNIKPEISAMPIMPDPFAAFLQEGNRKKIDIKELEHQRIEFKQHIRIMQEKIKHIDKELADIKKEKQNKKE